MAGILEDLFNTRTDHAREGTLHTEWDRILFWRDLRRFIIEGLVEPISCPSTAPKDFRETLCFRDLGTGEVYVYVEGWERGAPGFRKLTEQ